MAAPTLQRTVGLPGAIIIGLGSIVGTGVFVSLGLAAGTAGGAIVLAVVLGGLVATCNGLSSAQLAASHPVSGGTYEYGYRYLHPALGFTAGWMFLAAKSASAATAALGLAGYLVRLAVLPGGAETGLALAGVGLVTILVLTGVRRTNVVNAVVVTISLAALGLFVVACVLGRPAGQATPTRAPEPWLAHGVPGLLEATALMFVAYTGYGRIATLGEEVREPGRTIPRAVILTMIACIVLYTAVAAAATHAVGATGFGRLTEETSAPLEAVAEVIHRPAVARIVAIGAITAMLGVLLNLVLGLSRVVLAMGRRGDLPGATARLNAAGTTPWIAVIVVAVIVAGLALIGDVRTTWSFSAFTVLVYYAITNAAALRLPPEARRFPRIVSWGGLLSCAFLAFFVEPAIWITGLGVIGAGLLWFAAARAIGARAPSS